MRRLKQVFAILILIALALGAYAAYTYFNHGKVVQGKAIIYLIKATPTDFQLVPVEREIEGVVSPVQAVQALLDGPLLDEDLSASVPSSAKLLSLEIRDTLATVNFSSEIVSDFTGGSLMEAYLVEAIVNTLTEFTDIEKVQILVDGLVVESIGGHILTLQPLQRRD